MSVLILGKNGMLGSMLYAFLKSEGMEVSGTQRVNNKFPYYLNIDERYLGVGFPDHSVTGIRYLVNCIGATRLDRASFNDFRLGFYINAIFPVYLQKFCIGHSIKIIHISTDAVFQGGVHPYYEDHLCDGLGDYSLSKILGEVNAFNVLNIRCSIVGPEKGRNRNLLGWFLSQKDGDMLQGYTNHIWNGVTTLQLSEFICRILTDDLFDDILKKTGVIHFSPNLPLSKYEMMKVFKEIYKKNIRIAPVQAETSVQRILHSRFSMFYPEQKADFPEAVSRIKVFSENYPQGAER
jgi:dTDP-4-dehydrorhamnose reductase